MQRSPIRYHGVSEAISRLRTEAGEAGDLDMVDLCDRALSGERYALDWCTMVIDAAAAFASELVDELVDDLEELVEGADCLWCGRRHSSPGVLCRSCRQDPPATGGCGCLPGSSSFWCPKVAVSTSDSCIQVKVVPGETLYKSGRPCPCLCHVAHADYLYGAGGAE